MNTYFERYAYPHILFNSHPEESLKICVVIPCYNEPDILASLISLNNCNRVDGVEVIVVINEPETCDDVIKLQNHKSLDEIATWEKHNTLNFNLLFYHLIARDSDAGVGFARKVGMDEAARRFEQLQRTGVICCFDADSTCAPNYLESVDRHFFSSKAKLHGGAVYFEHVMPKDPWQKEGIIQYELHLRYYIHALRLIGYPYAHQTVGSSMIVRSNVYQKIGGMNKRKAGEDFYFLHRLMPTGHFIDINDTTIYPSARISNRVPFGTGKAMAKWQTERPTSYLTYNLKSFLDLQILFIEAGSFFNVEKLDYEVLMDQLPNSITLFLNKDGFEQVVARLNSQSNNLSTFIKKWYQYFDGLKVLKYLHFARDNYYNNSPVAKEAKKLLNLRWQMDDIENLTPANLLAFFRQTDRTH